MRGRRDERHEIQAVLTAERIELCLFFERYIRQDKTVHADLCCGADEALRAVGINHVRIGHEHHRNVSLLTDAAHHVENLIRCGSGRQCAHICLLNDRALRSRIGERNTQLDEVCAGVRHRVHDLLGDVQRRVAAGHERDKRLAACKGSLNLTHGCSLLCNVQSQRSPCRRGRKC